MEIIIKIKQEVGQRLKSYRTSKGYSQEKFAALCGLDRTYIAGVEAGKRNISIENLQKIADALQLSLNEFFDFTLPVHSNFILNINGTIFNLQSSKELTREIKTEIELIAQYAFDEDESTLLDVADTDNLEDLYEMSVYEIAGLFEKKIKKDLNIDVIFKPIELEVMVNYC